MRVKHISYSNLKARACVMSETNCREVNVNRKKITKIRLKILFLMLCETYFQVI